jgi:hypothetical protein
MQGNWKQLPILNERHGIRIDATTAATRWRGEKMDYGIGIWALMQRRVSAVGVSAETSGSGDPN